MVGKQGFIRTLEAIIAILLVLGFLLYILPRRPVLAEPTIPESIESAKNFVLREFLTNKDIRDCIKTVNIISAGGPSNGLNCLESSCAEPIKRLLDQHAIPGYDYFCEICNNIAPCTQLPRDTMKKSVYPGAVLIYFASDNVKYLRIYFWKR